MAKLYLNQGQLDSITAHLLGRGLSVERLHHHRTPEGQLYLEIDTVVLEKLADFAAEVNRGFAAKGVDLGMPASGAAEAIVSMPQHPLHSDLVRALLPDP